MNKISKRWWGNVGDGDVYLFKMINQKGAFVEISNYGATLISVHTHDKDGILGNIILGFPLLRGYVNDQNYIGATVGRFANRIANASFSLDGKIFKLEQNDGPNHNHGGSSGFHKKTFAYETNGDTLIFSLLSVDGDGGFPGNLKVQVHYRWTDDNELKIDYFGETDQDTLFNLTNHSYFNLSAGKGHIFEHHLHIYANQIVEAGADYISTGKIVAADDTNTFSDCKIGDKLLQSDGKIKGLNTCYALDFERQTLDLPVAALFDPLSGRKLSLYTSYPGVLLYTGDYLNTTDKGHNDRIYTPFDGVCLEAQYFPGSPNHVSFPSPVLKTGTTAHHAIIFKFDIHTNKSQYEN
ncbi:aldose epimerase family protein [Pedobacter hiemivivus]|uniref:Aldose 1-epimerase n=1 Tax=Pedobacter hiemivivus TaxID=2530454 RepID=A0A4R0MIH1_9SPHI|nr:aldose epimerase family protein [Pedobacter hiemivivus]TCC86345.1 galactose mutarotase [Pedobacter hiemivivus]